MLPSRKTGSGPYNAMQGMSYETPSFRIRIITPDDRLEPQNNTSAEEVPNNPADQFLIGDSIVGQEAGKNTADPVEGVVSNIIRTTKGDGMQLEITTDAGKKVLIDATTAKKIENNAGNTDGFNPKKQKPEDVFESILSYKEFISRK